MTKQRNRENKETLRLLDYKEYFAPILDYKLR